MQFLAFLIAVRKNKWHFWNPETKLDKIDLFLEENFDFENLTFFDLIWPYIDLSLGQIQKWMPPSYSAFQMTHKTCVARQTCNIFIWWPYLTWPWPWPLLTIRPILTRNLLQPLRSLLAKFGFAAIISRISVADKAKSDRLDLWPDRDLDCNLFKIYF